MLSAKYQREEDQVKHDITLRFVEAQAIASRIGYMFSDKKKRKEKDMLQPWDVFPDLFSEEQEALEEAKEERALAQHKAQMEMFAAKWNERRKGQSNVE